MSRFAEPPSAMPTISVLIPCYNGLPFVLESVQSVLDQLDGSAECVVVDDGSSDGSAEAVLASFGSRVRLVRQPNGGVAAARNRAVAESTGELIAWLDADDRLAAGSIDCRLRAFALDPSLEMLVGQVEIIDTDTGARELSPRPPCGEGYVKECLLTRTNLPHMNVITMRRSALDRVERFDGSCGVGEEFIVWLTAFSLLRWRFVEVVLAHQRQGSHDSLTHRLGKLGHYGEQEAMLRGVRSACVDLFHSDRPWRTAWALYAADFALVLLARGHRRAARVWALRALVAKDSRVRLRAAKYLCELTAPRMYEAVSRLRQGGWRAASGETRFRS